MADRRHQWLTEGNNGSQKAPMADRRHQCICKKGPMSGNCGGLICFEINGEGGF